MSAEQKNRLDILKYMLSGGIIILISLIVVLVFRLFLVWNNTYENRLFELEKTYQKQLEDDKAEIYNKFFGVDGEVGANSQNSDLIELGAETLSSEQQKELEAGKKAILKKYMDLQLELDKQEAYYKYYTENKHENTREGRDYHYYGQYYELFNNVYDANVIFIGSSRSVYGINPKILEQNDDLDAYSFYNFSLNAAGPQYYVEWYDIFKNEAKYPTPDTVIYCVDWFMFDSGGWMWRKLDSYDANPGGALYEIRKYMKGSTKSLSSELIVLDAIAVLEAETPELTDEAPTVEPGESIPAEKPGTPTNFSEFISNWWDKFNQKSPEQRLIDWWNGDERLNLSFVSEGLNTYVQPFANQKDLPKAIDRFLSGEFFMHTEYYAKEAALKAKNQTELEIYRAELEDAFSSILGGTEDGSNDTLPGDTTPGDTLPDNGDGTNPGEDATTTPDGTTVPGGDTIDIAAALAEFEEQQKANILKKYYTNKSLCIDKDGNVSSKFYKGFIPWEYEYHHEGDKTQFHEISKSSVQRVKGTKASEVDAFKQLIKTMQADGIEVILVQIPDYAPLRPDDQIAEYTSMIEDLATELGVEFYDYNNASSEVGNSVAKTKGCYSNWNHLNETGSTRFTREFAKELVDILKD